MLMKKLFVFSMLMLLTTFIVSAQTTYSSGDFKYTLDANGNATITHYTNSVGNVEIPETIDGHTVTAIGELAFLAKYVIQSITIPKSVTTIDRLAFLLCSSLKTVTILTPSNLKTIGEAAFSNSTSLSSINIPDGVVSIESTAFYNCTALESLTVPSSVKSIGEDAFYLIIKIIYKGDATGAPWGAILLNDNYYVDGDYIYADKNKKKLLMYTGTSSSVAIPSTVTSIGPLAFANNTTMTSVSIPNSVTSIDKSVFSGCTALSSVNIPTGVSTISNAMFDGCKALKSITIPNNITSIGDLAFYSSGLTSITIPNSVNRIGVNTFGGCVDMRTIKVPSTVTEIGESAFGYIRILKYDGPATGEPWGALVYKDYYQEGDLIFKDNTKQTLILYDGSGENVEIPSTVKTIGKLAFKDCISLKSVIIPNGITDIEERAFSGCTGLTEINLLNTNAPTIDWTAFTNVPLVKIRHSDNCYNAPWGAKSVELYDGDYVYADSPKSILLKYIGDGGDITIPDNVTNIAKEAFKNCSGITSVIVPSQVYSIGENAFLNVPKLTYSGIATGAPWGALELNLIDGDFVYADGAKKYLKEYNGRLDDVSIPEGVETIGKQAFYLNRYVKNVTLPSTVKTIEYQAFHWTDNLKNISIPSSVESIGAEAFYGDDAIQSLTLQEGLKYIKYRAFYQCTGLTYINIPSSVTELGSQAFSETNIASITIPSSVKSLDNGLFHKCKNLTSVILSEGLTTIETCAFESCSGLTNITIPSSVTKIGDAAFYGCTNMADVYCYADPRTLTWIVDKDWLNFKLNDGADDFTPTKFHVLLADKEIWESDKFKLANVTFVYDLIDLNSDNITVDPIPNKIYDGKEYIPTVVVKDGEKTLKLNTDYVVELPTSIIDVDSYTITIIGVGEYGGRIQKSFAITKATPTVTAPVPVNGLEFNGKAQVLVTQGKSSVGSLVYSLDGKAFSEQLPTATEAGDYTVYYKVLSSNNWEGVDVQSVKVSIAAKPQEKPDDNTTPVLEVASANVVKIWSFGNTIFVENATEDVTVFNISGNQILKTKPNSTHEELQIAKSGIYIVKSGSQIQKVIIQ